VKEVIGMTFVIDGVLRNRDESGPGGLEEKKDRHNADVFDLVREGCPTYGNDKVRRGILAISGAAMV
jgi:hypothetical protein